MTEVLHKYDNIKLIIQLTVGRIYYVGANMNNKNNIKKSVYSYYR